MGWVRLSDDSSSPLNRTPSDLGRAITCHFRATPWRSIIISLIVPMRNRITKTRVTKRPPAKTSAWRIQCKRRRPAADLVRCEDCNERDKRYKLERRRRLREAGICPYCGTRAIKAGERRCSQCTAFYRARVSKAKSLGLCRNCLIRPRTESSVQCSICLARRSKSEKRIYRRRVEAGMCIEWGKSLL